MAKRPSALLTQLLRSYGKHEETEGVSFHGNEGEYCVSAGVTEVADEWTEMMIEDLIATLAEGDEDEIGICAGRA
jgi:hypothetical protein